MCERRRVIAWHGKGPEAAGEFLTGSSVKDLTGGVPEKEFPGATLSLRVVKKPYNQSSRH